MGLFSRHEDAAPPVQEKTVESQRRSNLFSRKDAAANEPVNNDTTKHSHFSGLLHRSDADPSIRAAHDRVVSAEAAEREADKALLNARVAVREARAHVKRLEKEAAEEARLAKIKQGQAASISKRAKPLGRHERV